jgi:transposase
MNRCDDRLSVKRPSLCSIEGPSLRPDLPQPGRWLIWRATPRRSVRRRGTTGAIPVVPSRKNAKQPELCPDYIYRHRNLIERCWSRLKEWRPIATRYDETATSYAAGFAIAATLDWFKSSRRQVIKCEQTLATPA